MRRVSLSFFIPNNLPFHLHSEAFIHIHLHNGLVFFQLFRAIIICSLLESQFTIAITVVVDDSFLAFSVQVQLPSMLWI